MNELRYTLLGDGNFDEALIPVVSWVLKEAGVIAPIQSSWAELDRVPQPPRKLPDRIAMAVALYPCDILFVHRDAEKQPSKARTAEIARAVSVAQKKRVAVPSYVPVIPVRMTEAWLLFDETSIRRAAGNPSGTQILKLSQPSRWDEEPNPKLMLREALLDATELRGRRRSRFESSFAAKRVADLIDDYSPLRRLSAFRDLESDVARVVRSSRLAP